MSKQKQMLAELDNEYYHDDQSCDNMEVLESKLLNSQKDEYHDSIKSYLREISQYNLLTADEEKELSKQIQTGDEKALHLLINSNLRLVVKMAKAYISRDYPFIDLIQDGNLGLMRAAEKFDYKKNVRFSTYAARWIQQTILRSLSQKKRMVRIPYRKEKTLREIKEVSNQYMDEQQRLPSNQEISKELGLKMKEVNDTIFSEISVCSLDAELTNDNFSLENIVSDDQLNPDKSFIRKELEEETHKMLDKLYPNEKLVLVHRFGLDDEKKQTFKEMGKQLGLSAETIRQMEIRVLQKIKSSHTHLRAYITN